MHRAPFDRLGGSKLELNCNWGFNLKSLFTLKKCAFTLAEVLITLGIIGVVAAITLPTLIQNHQKQTYVTALKKAYSNLQNAYAQMALDEDVTEWEQTYCFSCGFVYGSPGHEACCNRVKKYFNVVKSGEYGTEPLGLSSYTDASMYFYTNDGMYYVISTALIVDVNGDKGPNKWGRDRFAFEVNWNKNKIEPYGLSNYQTYCTPEKLKQNEYNGLYCTAKVLIEGKMDY